MFVLGRCPRCPKSLRVDERNFGKRHQCPFCGHVFVPQRPEPSGNTGIPQDDDVVELEAVGPPPTPSRAIATPGPVDPPHDAGSAPDRSSDPPDPPSSRGPLLYDDGLVSIGVNLKVRFNVSSPQEAKLAIKGLRTYKRAVQLQKKDGDLKMRAIRAEYTRYARQRLPKMRGGGDLGRLIRTAQELSHYGQRHDLASSLAPYEEAKQRFEQILLLVDAAILQIQMKFL